MFATRVTPGFLIASLLTGCSVHPLPEDVTPFDTYAIVKKIRCEARESIAKKAIGFFASRPETKQLAVELEQKQKTFGEIDIKTLDPYARFFVQKYYGAAIAYDFTFDITEDNDISTQVDFVRTFTNGVFGAGVKAEDDRMRETTRNFRISDTFGGLLTGPLECGADAPANYAYPITGTIGLKEMIDTFIDLNEFQNLAGATETSKVPVLADTFNFQTTITGSISPHVTLSPVTRGLADASLGASGMRKDIHKVIVAMSLPPATKGKASPHVSAGVLSPGFHVASAQDGRTAAENRAIDEIYDQITRSILFNTPQRTN